jgi:hypothetical protein
VLLQSALPMLTRRMCQIPASQQAKLVVLPHKADAMHHEVQERQMPDIVGHVGLYVSARRAHDQVLKVTTARGAHDEVSNFVRLGEGCDDEANGVCAHSHQE